MKLKGSWMFLNGYKNLHNSANFSGPFFHRCQHLLHFSGQTLERDTVKPLKNEKCLIIDHMHRSDGKRFNQFRINVSCLYL